MMMDDEKGESGEGKIIGDNPHKQKVMWTIASHKKYFLRNKYEVLRTSQEIKKREKNNTTSRQHSSSKEASSRCTLLFFHERKDNTIQVSTFSTLKPAVAQPDCFKPLIQYHLYRSWRLYCKQWENRHRRHRYSLDWQHPRCLPLPAFILGTMLRRSQCQNWL